MQYSGDKSKPRYCRPSFLQARAVVPDPMNGSNTTSPSLLLNKIQVSGKAIGKPLCPHLLAVSFRPNDLSDTLPLLKGIRHTLPTLAVSNISGLALYASCLFSETPSYVWRNMSIYSHWSSIDVQCSLVADY